MPISAQDRGFTLGDGVFDTALALNGVMFARARHVARLLAAARSIGIAVEPAAVEAAIDAALTLQPLIVRTTLTRGLAGRGLWPATSGVPTLVVTTAPWSPALLGVPARLVTASGRRNERSPTANLKTLGYLDHILAAREASERGADDALLLNTRDRIACTTIANVFALFGERLVTPPLTEGCLPGIVRALVLEIAPTLGLTVKERPLEPAELRKADAVFLSNSVRFLRRVAALDDGALHGDDAGAAVAQIQARLRADLVVVCGPVTGA